MPRPRPWVSLGLAPLGGTLCVVDPPSELPGGAADPPHRARRVVAEAGVTVLVVGALLVGYGWLAFRNSWFPFHSSPPREVTLGEARERFERGGHPVAGDRPFVPPAGVYRYEGEGSERLSNPPRTQAEGPEMPGTVVHRPGGCWDLRLDYSTNHWRRWHFCADETGLTQKGTRVYQRWDFGAFAVDNLTVVSCAPPAVVMEPTMTPGQGWRSRCRGESTAISGTTLTTGTHRFLGTQALTIGGEHVDSYHFRDVREVSGAQTGTERFDFWLAAGGLVLRGEQAITIESDSPLGRITYTQAGSFTLVSLVPAR